VVCNPDGRELIDAMWPEGRVLKEATVSMIRMALENPPKI
jgi:hypothetical protein